MKTSLVVATTAVLSALLVGFLTLFLFAPTGALPTHYLTEPGDASNVSEDTEVLIVHCADAEMLHIAFGRGRAVHFVVCRGICLSETIARSFGECRRLETIAFEDCTGCTPGVIGILAALEGIVSVQFARCADLTDEGVVAFGHSPSLILVAVVDCSRVTASQEITKGRPRVSVQTTK